ncbi:hypothetical protein ACOMHN_000369 [Nucella lapillus]
MPMLLMVTCLLVVTCGLTSCELLRNGGFEQKMTGWDCWGIRCEVLGHSQSHHGAHAIRTHNRTHHYQGPSQTIQTEAGNDYRVQSWVRLLNDLPNTLGQTTDLEVSFHLADNSNSYINMVTAKVGWILIQGEFQAPPQAAGRRLLDLLENQWMTDETFTPSKHNDVTTLRGFHGDYELHVHYQGRELSNLKKTFTLGTNSHTVNLHEAHNSCN